MKYLQKTKKDSKYLKKQEIYDIFIKTNQIKLDMAYKFFKDLAGRLASDKILRDKSFNIAKNLKYDEYQHGIASMASKCFDKEIFWWSN